MQRFSTAHQVEACEFGATMNELLELLGVRLLALQAWMSGQTTAVCPSMARSSTARIWPGFLPASPVLIDGEYCGRYS